MRMSGGLERVRELGRMLEIEPRISRFIYPDAYSVRVRVTPVRDVRIWNLSGIERTVIAPVRDVRIWTRSTC